MDASRVRLANDVAAVVACAVSAGVVCAEYDVSSSSRRMLVAMQFVSILAHVFYLFRVVLDWTFLNTRNQYKWLEYSVSATLGTVALLDDIGDGAIAAVAAVSAMQQVAGLYLDKEYPNTPVTTRADIVAFGFAAAVQVANTVLVITERPWQLALAYSVGWGMFGVHAGMRLWGHELSTRYNDAAWVEGIYGALGWTAKLAVFALEFAPDKSMTVGLTGLTWASVLCVTAMATAAATTDSSSVQLL